MFDLGVLAFRGYATGDNAEVRVDSFGDSEGKVKELPEPLAL